MLRKGESGRSAQPSSDEKQPEGKRSVDSKRKRSEVDENEDLDAPRRTCGKHIDYRVLENPFPDEEEDQEDDLVTQLCASTAEAIAQSGGDEPKSLKEALGSPEWPEWEHAVKKS